MMLRYYLASAIIPKTISGAKLYLAKLFLETPHAVNFGDFRLASGQHSSYYIDAKKVTLITPGIKFISKEILSLFPSFDAVGGLVLGAAPVVSGVVALADRPIRGFLVRKVTKDHGTQKAIEGNLDATDKVLVVEDVTTTGASLMEAVGHVRDAGAEVIGAVSVLDRLQGAAELLSKESIRFCSLITIRDLGI